MSEKIINTILQLRRGTAAQWEAVKDTFIPKAGEGCVTLDGAYAGQVKFGNGTSTWGALRYAGIVSTDGESIQSVNGVISIPGYAEAVSGQMLKKGADGLEWITLTPETIGAVKKEITGTNGKAIIFNESDGGGAKFEHTDGTEVFVGVNNGGENGLMAQIYADKLVSGSWVGSRINVYHNGIYYVSKANQLAGFAKNAPEMEIATKKDIATIGNALHFVGVAPKLNGKTEAESVEAAYPVANQTVGAVAICGAKEFICAGSPLAWTEFGDVSAYATKAEMQSADITLQANIDAEQLSREQHDEMLEGAIDLEATTRASEDTAIRSDLTAEVSRAQAAEATKVDKEITSSDGKAIIFNEADGGGAKFEHTDGTHSFVGVNNGGEEGIAAQIYAVDATLSGHNLGAKLDVTRDGIFYTTGAASGGTPSSRDKVENEIATKGDISDSLTGLNNKTQNLTAAGTLSTDYLTQGVNTFILDGGSASV